MAVFSPNQARTLSLQGGVCVGMNWGVKTLPFALKPL
jgi:hypothetical protein